MDITSFLLLFLLALNCHHGLGFIFSTNELHQHQQQHQYQLVGSKKMRRVATNHPHCHHMIKNKSSKLSFLWSAGDDSKKKKEKEENSKTAQSTKQNSKMGTTATTMENFKQSQELGKKTGSLTQELSSIQVEGVAAKGKIKVFVDGQQQPMSVEIDEEYFKQGGVEEFSEELLIAMQDAHDKSIQIMQDKMQGLYSDLGLPPSK
jgi:DNA-binding protein YbaB